MAHKNVHYYYYYYQLLYHVTWFWNCELKVQTLTWIGSPVAGENNLKRHSSAVCAQRTQGLWSGTIQTALPRVNSLGHVWLNNGGASYINALRAEKVGLDYREALMHPTGSLWREYGVAPVGRASDSDPKDEGSNPVRSTRDIWECFRVQKMLCWLAVGVPNPRVHTHAHKNDHVRTIKILWSMSGFGGLRKHEKPQHALNTNSWVGASHHVVVTVLMSVCEWMRAIYVSVRRALSHGDHGNRAY